MGENVDQEEERQVDKIKEKKVDILDQDLDEIIL